MANIQVKIPPHSQEAEISVLGALLLDKNAIVNIAEFLHPEHFYDDRHSWIYESMVELYESREPIDMLTVAERLKRKKKLKEVGGSGYLAQLVNQVPTAAHIEHYGKIVKDAATKRSLMKAAAKLVELSLDDGMPAEALLDEAESEVFSLTQKHIAKSFTPVRSTLAESFDKLDELHKNPGGLRGVPSGFKSLDDALAGFQRSNLVIVAARPGVGKTAFALGIAQHIAVRLGRPVGVFSLEMSNEELVDRLLVSQANIDAWRLKTGKLSEDDFTKLSDAMGELAEAPLYIDDTPALTILEMRTKARRLQVEHGLDLLIVDYLQLAQGRTKDNRVTEVSEISQGLKNLARELRIPVIALSQLNRSVEQRGTKRPQLADLRESGCLSGDTLLMRADTGELVMIKDLVGKKNVPVYSLNEELKLEVKNISKVFSSGRKRLYELKTRTGRTIKASANHPFYTIEGWKRLDELEEGTHLGIPRSLDFKSTEDPMSSEELILLAHLIGDGCVLPNQPIHYTSADKENLMIVAKVASYLFDIKPRLVKQENWYHLHLPSPYRLARGRYNPIVNWYKSLGLERVRSYKKVLPEKIFKCSTKSIDLFLHHLWATDGNISWKNHPTKKPGGSIYYSTTSEILGKQIQHLLLRVGITSVLRQKLERNGRLSYQICIQGSQMQIRFCELVGSYGTRGKILKELLVALKNLKPNPNLDVIPPKAWKDFVEPAKDYSGLGWRGVSAGIGMSYCGTSLFRNGISRSRMERLAISLESTKLYELANSDIYWDEIVSVKKLGIEEVFDATVPGTHNFVANDFIVHNSIEQDADVVMFLYREDDDNLEDLKLDIAKHRNGALRQIPMFFKGDRIKFFEKESERKAA